MRGGWVAAMMVALALAGCADSSPQDGVRVVQIASESEAAAARAAPTYTFVVYGTPMVEDDTRQVDIRIFAGGRAVPDDILSYEARPGGSKEALAIYQMKENVVHFDAYADGEFVGGASLDMAECSDRDGDADFFVSEPRFGSMGGVEIHYGCSS